MLLHFLCSFANNLGCVLGNRKSISHQYLTFINYTVVLPFKHVITATMGTKQTPIKGVFLFVREIPNFSHQPISGQQNIMQLVFMFVVKSRM